MTRERWRQIEELYHSARESGRGVLADVAPDLRGEVERLLAQESGGAILDQPAADLLDDSGVSEFAPGIELGPYRIEAHLGAGGMGEVFRAIDTRLGRAVAIKTCREQFSERFYREARAISSLNHPHICTLHDVGPNYLVMELVEGETLAARFERGKLSIEQTVEYGTQIADALAAAQAKCIVHRDLKPANIMLTTSGVKVLDFGIAKSAQEDSLTISRVVMGTPAYMSPEQRAGEECDGRSDIYALGLVLYEMASGKRFASGARLGVGLPADLQRIIAKCLENDRELRYQHASDVRIDLQRLKREQKPKALRKRGIPLAVAAAVIATLAVWAGLRREKNTGPIQVQQLTTNSSENPIWQPVISPDGQYLAYGDLAGIQIRQISSGESHLLPRPQSLSAGDAWFPAAWFPDGTHILASSEGKITTAWTVSAIGATATRLRDNARVYSVSPDGSLIAFTTGKELRDVHHQPVMMNNEIWVMGPRGENARSVTAGDDRTYFGSVQWSPDGKRLAYRKLSFASETSPEYKIESCDLNGGTPSVILSTRRSYFYNAQPDIGLADNFCWTPDNRVIYALHEPPPNPLDRNLWAISVDRKTGKARNSPHRITNFNGFRMGASASRQMAGEWYLVAHRISRKFTSDTSYPAGIWAVPGG